MNDVVSPFALIDTQAQCIGRLSTSIDQKPFLVF